MLFGKRDVVEIPAININRKPTWLIVVIIVFWLLLICVVIQMNPSIVMPTLIIMTVCIIGCLFFSDTIIYLFVFLLWKKKKIKFEFSAENLICDGKAIKWTDIRRIYFSEIDSRSMNNFVYLTVDYEQNVEDKVKNEKFDVYMVKGSLFRSPEEVLKLIADKYYQYFGVLHGTVLKK